MAPIGNKNGLKHGQCGTPLYMCWLNMRARCNNPKNPQYKDYGGRGIYVCKRWDNFENFIADMGPRPPNYTLDRIDNNGPYTPENCHWASRSAQQKNRRTYYTSLAREAEKLGIRYRTLWARLNRRQRRGESHG